MRIPCALILLSACQAEPAGQDASRPTSKPPAQFCAQLAEGLETLRKKGAMDFDAAGQATIEEQIWLGLGPDGRERLARSLAFHASCSAPQGLAEQQVTIRNNWGVTVMQRTIDTGADIGALLDE